MNRHRKSILLLGGSRQQVPVIQKAKDLGFRTVLIDYLSDNPGKDIADVWYSESTTDIDAVYRIAKEEGVSGILAYASDPAALPAAIVCERLGLPTNPSTSVEILGIKHKFREFLQQNRFACPKHCSFSKDISIEDLKKSISEFKFPIVVKPTDSSGSKGVSFLKDTSELSEALSHAKDYSRNGILIVEEFIERGFPDIIGGDIFVQDGRIIFYGDMACIRGDKGKSLIPIGEKLPNGLNERQRSNLHNELDRLVKLLNIKFGELNIEVIIDREDKPHFLEVGPRAGGNMIPLQLAEAYNIDLLEANVLTAMGERVNLNFENPTDAYATYVLHSKEEGNLKEIKIDDSLTQYIYRTVLYKNIGDKIEKFDGAGKAIGIIFMKFPSQSIMTSFQTNLEKYVKIQIAE